MTAFIEPDHVDRDLVLPRIHPVRSCGFEDIEHSRVRGQCLAECQSEQQFFGGVCNLGFQRRPAGKRDDDGVRFLGTAEEETDAHQQNRKQHEGDDAMPFLIAIGSQPRSLLNQ